MLLIESIANQYFGQVPMSVASCGGVTIEQIKKYVENQAQIVE